MVSISFYVQDKHARSLVLQCCIDCVTKIAGQEFNCNQYIISKRLRIGHGPKVHGEGTQMFCKDTCFVFFNFGPFHNDAMCTIDRHDNPRPHAYTERFDSHYQIDRRSFYITSGIK